MGVLNNPKWERFAQELAKGKTATEAYETAGYKPSRFHASSLKQKSHIAERVAELLADRDKVHVKATAKAMEELAIDREWVFGAAYGTVLQGRRNPECAGCGDSGPARIGAAWARKLACSSSGTRSGLLATSSG